MKAGASGASGSAVRARVKQPHRSFPLATDSCWSVVAAEALMVSEQKLGAADPDGGQTLSAVCPVWLCSSMPSTPSGTFGQGCPFISQSQFSPLFPAIQHILGMVSRVEKLVALPFLPAEHLLAARFSHGSRVGHSLDSSTEVVGGTPKTQIDAGRVAWPGAWVGACKGPISPGPSTWGC